RTPRQPPRRRRPPPRPGPAHRRRRSRSLRLRGAELLSQFVAHPTDDVLAAEHHAIGESGDTMWNPRLGMETFTGADLFDLSVEVHRDTALEHDHDLLLLVSVRVRALPRLEVESPHLDGAPGE